MAVNRTIENTVSDKAPSPTSGTCSLTRSTGLAEQVVTSLLSRSAWKRLIAASDFCALAEEGDHTSRRGSSRRAIKHFLPGQPVVEVVAPDAQCAVGQPDAARPSALLAPVMERGPGDFSSAQTSSTVSFSSGHDSKRLSCLSRRAGIREVAAAHPGHVSSHCASHAAITAVKRAQSSAWPARRRPGHRTGPCP